MHLIVGKNLLVFHVIWDAYVECKAPKSMYSIFELYTTFAFHAPCTGWLSNALNP